MRSSIRQSKQRGVGTTDQQVESSACLPASASLACEQAGRGAEEGDQASRQAGGRAGRRAGRQAGRQAGGQTGREYVYGNLR